MDTLKSKKIVAVIVTFNRLQKLKVTLSRSLKESYDHILVVNNQSTDGTSEWLEGEQASRENVTVVHMTDNLGGAGGFEYGFKYATETLAADWLVAYDDDAFPHEGIIDRFRDISIEKDVAVVSAAVFDSDGNVAEMNRPSRNPFSSIRLFLRSLVKGRGEFHIDDSDFTKEEPMHVDVSSFVGFFFRCEVAKQHSYYPWGELFIYADDVLYSLGLRKLGYRILFCPQLVFTHDCGSVSKDSKHFRHPFQPLWKVYYTYRNNIEVFRQIAPLLFVPIFTARLIKWALNARFYQDKWVYFRVLRLALCHGLLRRYKFSHDEVLNQLKLKPSIEKGAQRLSGTVGKQLQL